MHAATANNETSGAAFMAKNALNTNFKHQVTIRQNCQFLHQLNPNCNDNYSKILTTEILRITIYWLDIFTPFFELKQEIPAGSQ